MISIRSLVALATIGFVAAQNPGNIQTESHPSLTVSTCTSSGCTTSNGQLVLDANWRWISNSAGTNCYDGPTYASTNGWNPSICPQGDATSDATCASKCYIQGNSVAQYQSTYGVTTSGNSLTIGYVEGSNVGARLYLMDSTTTYQLFKLKNREFTFTVDVSKLGCALNGALYFTNMDATGNLGGTNKAGAQYGTGYCDSQCPHDIKFANGMANVEGTNGNCCPEFDVWESNKYATAFTSHMCSSTGLQVCNTAATCGDGSQRANGYCDKDGCDINTYRNGVTNFFGPGLTVDSTSPVTVVTQFITADGTDTGTLSEVRRYYVQNGKVISTPASTAAGLTGYNSLTDSYCNAERTAFSDTNPLKGAITGMDAALSQGMVLSLSLWDDDTAGMNWLDSAYPQGSTAEGAVRGPCPWFNWTTQLSSLRSTQGSSSSVTYSNIKFGTLCSTFDCTGISTANTATTAAAATTTKAVTTAAASTTKATTAAATTKATTTTTTTTSTTTTSTTTTTTTTTTTKAAATSAAATSASGSCSAKWGQCGGLGWTGPTCCTASTCTYGNAWYSQCL
ncbi:hypothetical protein HDU83_008233 [Entophlyctis luteolus]|nr:hypothetical protein HDU83_008233 [Entophlyctis luteolus]